VHASHAIYQDLGTKTFQFLHKVLLGVPVKSVSGWGGEWVSAWGYIGRGGGSHGSHGSRFEIGVPSADAGMALKFGGAKFRRDRHASPE
jgi:hypothetical protein